MATSGSSNFTQTRNEIIQDAFALLGVYGVGRTISSEDMLYASNVLNKLVKDYQKYGLHLWSKEEAYLFLADNTGEYTLSSDSSSARACLRSDAVITELSEDEAIGQTTISVESSTGMTTSDIVGIVCEDDSVLWSTISSIPDSTSIVIADALTVAAEDGANVYTFTSRITKPLRILSARRVDGGPDSPVSIEMRVLSHDEYFNLSSKESNGTPTQYYYNPDLTTGKLYLWPRPENPEVYIEFTYERILEDFDAAGDNADFPSEWLRCLTYNLAADLAPAYGKANSLAVLEPKAERLLQDMLNWDHEITSIQIKPGYSR